MTIYILHIEPRLAHAGHYVGYTPDADPSRRVNEHLRCTAAGNPLVKAAVSSGRKVTLACTLEGDRDRERQIKRSKNTARYCAICREMKRKVA